MRSRFPLVSVLSLAAVAVVPAVATAQSFGPLATAQSFDPSTFASAGGGLRALASVAVVGLVGAAVLLTRGSAVERGVEATAERPLVGVVYGMLAYVLVLVVALFANDVLTRVGLAGTPLGYVAVAVLVGGLAGVVGVGYLLAGALLTDVLAGWRPWQGLALGAALSGLAWLALPTTAAIAAWVFVPAVGIGGPMRSWVHRERTVATEMAR